MQDYLRGDTLEQLNQAWREAALGTKDQNKRHMGEILERLEQSTGADEAVRDCIESARAAVKRSDSLGVVLALVAAMQELQHEPINGQNA